MSGNGGLGASVPQVAARANEGSGAAIVAGKGKCLTCHRIDDTGSRIGPDLTDIGAIRTIEQIRTSIVDPDAEILPENRSYRVVTRDGATITGTLLNHDTFQVLMRDPKDQLRSFTKSELARAWLRRRLADAIVSIDVVRRRTGRCRRVSGLAERSRRTMSRTHANHARRDALC